MWNGAISFGLVTVPIHVQSATENHSIQFHQYHLEDMGRVRVKKVCELEDREIPQSEISKGYEYAKDQIVAISDADLRELPLPTAKALEIEAFVPLESIDPIQIGEGYYLVPDGQVAAKPYKLLVQALGRSSKVAVAKYAWSGRERLGLLRIRGNVIVLHAMRWPDEIRDPAAVDPCSASWSACRSGTWPGRAGGSLRRSSARPNGSAARYRAKAWRPCCVCGLDYRTSRPIDFPGYGPRWVDLCRDHSLAVRKPALPTMPTTVEGAFADIREIAAKYGLTMRTVSHEEWQEMGRRARRRRDQ